MTVLARREIAEHGPVATFTQHAHLQVIASEVGLGSARCAAAQHGARDHAVIVASKFARGELFEIGAKARPHQPRRGDLRPSKSDDALDIELAGREKLANRDDVLIVDVGDFSAHARRL